MNGIIEDKQKKRTLFAHFFLFLFRFLAHFLVESTEKVNWVFLVCGFIFTLQKCVYLCCSSSKSLSIFLSLLFFELSISTRFANINKHKRKRNCASDASTAAADAAVCCDALSLDIQPSKNCYLNNCTPIYVTISYTRKSRKSNWILCRWQFVSVCVIVPFGRSLVIICTRENIFKQNAFFNAKIKSQNVKRLKYSEAMLSNFYDFVELNYVINIFWGKKIIRENLWHRFQLNQISYVKASVFLSLFHLMEK